MIAVATAVLRRSLRHAFGRPALLVPSLVFPLMFLVSFAGGLSAVGDLPAFDYPAGYTAFQYVFVFLQSAAFGGVFTGFAIAADFESGFARRLLLASPQRLGIVLGYAGAALVRWLMTSAVVTLAALGAGMEVLGDPAQLLALLALGLLLNLAALLWAAGVAMRLQTLQAGPLMQVPVFLVLFMTPVFVPAELLTGWVDAAAEVNPVTALLEAGRGLLAGRPEGTPAAFAIAAVLGGAFFLWALRGLRAAERGVSRG